MIQNNNLSPLAFYRTEEYQNHRKSYAYGNIYDLYSPHGMLLPFQIIRKHSVLELESVELYSRDDVLVADITSAIIDVGLTIKEYPRDGYDVIVYPAHVPLSVNLGIGKYYIKLSDEEQTWYSEMFTNVSTMDGYVRVEWWDNEDFLCEAGRIVYEGIKYRNVVYLPTQVGKPEYKFTEEGEARDGFFFPEKQISEKVYKFNFVAPEFLCDAMRFIRMADNILITDELGRGYNCDTFLMSVKWQTQGDIASVEVEFETATVAKKIGKAYIPRRGGDFSIDFNSDYNTGNNDSGVSEIDVIISVYGLDGMVEVAADTTLMYDIEVSAHAVINTGHDQEVSVIIPAGQSTAKQRVGANGDFAQYVNIEVKKLNSNDKTNYIIKQK